MSLINREPENKIYFLNLIELDLLECNCMLISTAALQNVYEIIKFQALFYYEIKNGSKFRILRIT